MHLNVLPFNLNRQLLKLNFTHFNYKLIKKKRMAWTIHLNGLDVGGHCSLDKTAFWINIKIFCCCWEIRWNFVAIIATAGNVTYQNFKFHCAFYDHPTRFKRTELSCDHKTEKILDLNGREERKKKKLSSRCQVILELPFKFDTPFQYLSMTLVEVKDHAYDYFKLQLINGNDFRLWFARFFHLVVSPYSVEFSHHILIIFSLAEMLNFVQNVQCEWIQTQHCAIRKR